MITSTLCSALSSELDMCSVQVFWIMDQASKYMEPEAFIPQKLGFNKLVMVGDQLFLITTLFLPERKWIQPSLVERPAVQATPCTLWCIGPLSWGWILGARFERIQQSGQPGMFYGRLSHISGFIIDCKRNDNMLPLFCNHFYLYHYKTSLIRSFQLRQDSGKSAQISGDLARKGWGGVGEQCPRSALARNLLSAISYQCFSEQESVFF